MKDTNTRTTSEVMRITRDQPSCTYDPSFQPLAHIHSGEEIVVETHCCSRESVTRSISTSADRFYTDLGYIRGMSLSGPIAVQEAQVGDILRVDILDVQVAERGWTMALQDHGVIGNRIQTGESRIVPIRDEKFNFIDRVHLPIRPMLGCIGTSPSEPPFGAGPGPFGGNMDCKLIGEGTTVFLPVLVPGGNVAVGDMHAVQGDGEVGSAGVEIAGEVTMRFRVLRGLDLPLPLLETPDLIAAIHTEKDLKQAAVGAIERMSRFLSVQANLSLADAWMLLSLTADIRICQVVNPVMTCRMEVPKPVLSQLGIELAELWSQSEVGRE